MLEPTSPQHSLMRRTSVSLPTTKTAHDPHEKPARYSTTGASNSAASTLEKIKDAWMTQSQRSRYLKTGGILLFIVFLFYYLGPTGTSTSSNGIFFWVAHILAVANVFYRLIIGDLGQCRWTNSLRPVPWNNEVLEIQRQVEANRTICAHDRRRKYRFPNPCLPIQQLRCYP